MTQKLVKVIKKDPGRYCWSDLSAHEKRRAVIYQLLQGRTVQEAANMLSITYGAVGVNHVRKIICQHKLYQDKAVKNALVRREALAVATRKARQCSASRMRVQEDRAVVLPLPQIPLPDLKSDQQAGVALFDLKRNSCRAPLWENSETPLNEKFFCGKPARPHSSYCEACAAGLTVPHIQPTRSFKRSSTQRFNG